jgi:FMN phosphatase YigB (HAD superfamily)
VPDVLNSLGLKVSPLRYGAEHAVVAKGSVNWDVDFSVMSYDVGVEKPDRRIFEAAEEMAGSLADFKGEEGEAVEWEKVYVGDEYKKDVVGAVEAGWKAVLIDEGASSQKDGLIWRDDDQPGSLQDLFQSSNAIGLRSLTKFAEWLR